MAAKRYRRRPLLDDAGNSTTSASLWTCPNLDHLDNNEMTLTSHAPLALGVTALVSKTGAEPNHVLKPPTELLQSTAVMKIPMRARSGSYHVHVVVGHGGFLDLSSSSSSQQQQQQPQQHYRHLHHQVQTVIVDTGSRLTAWPCDPPCYPPACGVHQAAQYYQTEASSTFQTMTCQSCQWNDMSTCDTTHDRCILQQRYTEGSSWDAYEVSDLVALSLEYYDDGDNHENNARHDDGNINHRRNRESWTSQQRQRQASMTTSLYGVPFTFGCQTSVTGLFVKQYADGILGLERSNYTIVAALHRHGVIPWPMFALCMAPRSGWLGLGGPNTAHHRTPMQFTPQVSGGGAAAADSTIPTSNSQNQGGNNNNNSNNNRAGKNGNHNNGIYSVQVEQVWLGEHHCLTCHGKQGKRFLQAFHRGKGTILDSGTTDTFLPYVLHNAYATIWTQITGRPFTDDPTVYTKAELHQLPVLYIVLTNNVTLSAPPLHYMEGALHAAAMTSSRKETMTLTNRIYVDEPEGATLGINVLLGHDILFADEWIGIAPADCESRS